MSLLCPACKTENANDATACTHCAAALSAPQRMSLLEQAMARPAAQSPPTPPAPAAVATAAKPPPAPAPTIAKPPYAMPPLPAQPPAPRRRRTPWVLAAVLVLALLGAIAMTVYEQIQYSRPTPAAQRP